MVAATALNQAQLKPMQFNSSPQFNPAQSIKVANVTVLYRVAEYALFETAAALYVLATGKPDPRKTANSTAKSVMRPYTVPEAKAFADGLRETMQKYPDAGKAPKGFLAKLEKWKAAAYKANEPNSSLQLFAGEYIKDQKLLTNLRSLQGNPKASKAQRIEAQSLVMMAQGGENGWQKLAVRFLTRAETKKIITTNSIAVPLKHQITPEDRLTPEDQEFYKGMHEDIWLSKDQMSSGIKCETTVFNSAIDPRNNQPTKTAVTIGTVTVGGESTPLFTATEADTKTASTQIRGWGYSLNTTNFEKNIIGSQFSGYCRLNNGTWVRSNLNDPTIN